MDLGQWIDQDAPAWGSTGLPSDWLYLGPESVSEKVASGPGYEANAAMGIDYLIVVEKQEYDNYAKNINKDKILKGELKF